MGNKVITIGRQFGSGGRDIGKLLSEKLNVPYYDKDLVSMAAEKSNMDTEVLRSADEKAANSFLYSLVNSNPIKGINTMYYDMPINDKLFIAQSEVIKSVAAKSSCIIVGRCADYILEDTDAMCVNVFIHAPLGFRIERVAKDLSITKPQAKDKIIKTDKKRRSYYNYYSNREWDKIENYDLCIDSSKISFEEAAELIKSYVVMRDEG
ncbi:MAG: cytidylate kinase-like family protein [Oscillospiraceae bacterium]|nr:cytidylate kinase-like family protein [Oscillospiraceae bacterium]